MLVTAHDIDTATPYSVKSNFPRCRLMSTQLLRSRSCKCTVGFANVARTKTIMRSCPGESVPTIWEQDEWWLSFHNIWQLVHHDPHPPITDEARVCEYCRSWHPTWLSIWPKFPAPLVQCVLVYIYMRCSGPLLHLIAWSRPRVRPGSDYSYDMTWDPQNGQAGNSICF